MYTATYWAPNRCEHNTIYLWYPGTSQWRIQGRVLGDRVPPSPLFLDQTEKFFSGDDDPPPPLSKGLDDRPLLPPPRHTPPLSQGLEKALLVPGNRVWITLVKP